MQSNSRSRWFTNAGQHWPPRHTAIVNLGPRRAISRHRLVCRQQERSEIGSAVVSGLVDLKPSDPVEGMVASQIMVVHEAALGMYRRAWSQPPEYFEARCRYLQMAGKAQRTRAILTERLQGAGQHSITVKHVVNSAAPRFEIIHFVALNYVWLPPRPVRSTPYCRSFGDPRSFSRSSTRHGSPIARRSLATTESILVFASE